MIKNLVTFDSMNLTNLGQFAKMKFCVYFHPVEGTRSYAKNFNYKYITFSSNNST